MPAWTSGFVGAFFFASLVGVIGVLSARAWVSREQTQEQWERSLGAAALAFAFALCLSIAALFARQLVEFRDPYAPLSEDLTFLLGSPWGEAWKRGALASLLVMVGVGARKRFGNPALWLASAGALWAAALPGLTGHANGVEEWHAFTLFADWLHVVAAGTWIGGLCALVLVGRGTFGTVGFTRSVAGYSAWAQASVGTLLVTGVFASWAHLPSIASLTTSTYGRLLLAKVLLVLVTMVLGWRNWKKLSPILGSADADQRLVRSATIELALGQAILFVTAFLVRTSPLSTP